MKLFKKTNINFFLRITILILNIVVLFYIYSFYNKNVYGSIVVDENYILEQSKQSSGDINLKKFQATLDKLSEKKELKKSPSVSNFFE